MSKKNTLYFTGRENATLAFVAKHKKNGTALMRIFPIQYAAKNREPISADDYNKEDALSVFNFEDSHAIDTLIHFLNHMKENQIYIEGQRSAYDSMEEQYNESLEKMNNHINDLSDTIGQFTGQRKSVVVEMRTGFQTMPEELFAGLAQSVVNEIRRRETEKEKAGESNNKEKVKEEKVTEPVV